MGDFLKEELVDKLPVGVESFIVFDCCHSGTMFDMDYMYSYHNKKATYIYSPNNKKPVGVQKPGRSVYLSGCQDSECAAELTRKKNGVVSERGGALTFALLNVLESSDTITIAELLKTVDINVESRYQSTSISCSRPLDIHKTTFAELIDGKLT